VAAAAEETVALTSPAIAQSRTVDLAPQPSPAAANAWTPDALNYRGPLTGPPAANVPSASTSTHKSDVSNTDDNSPAQSDMSSTVAKSSSSPIASRRSARSHGEDPLIRKRQLNNAAARRYRQKRLDRISELEDVVRTMTQEREELKLQLAKKETEVDLLRDMLKDKRPS
jgi:hypothetical protein